MGRKFAGQKVPKWNPAYRPTHPLLGPCHSSAYSRTVTRPALVSTYSPVRLHLGWRCLLGVAIELPDWPDRVCELATRVLMPGIRILNVIRVIVGDSRLRPHEG